MKRFLPLLAIAFFACHETPQRPLGEAPVILISIDTLRADRVRPDLTPNILALAHDGTTFDRAYSHVPLTLPSHATILTGCLPRTTGVRDNAGYVLDPKLPTLAGILAANGYKTGGAVSSYVLRRSTGIDHGFSFFDDAVASGDALDVTAARPGDRTMKALLDWMHGAGAEKVFAFLHLYDPHAPYRAPAKFHIAGRSDYDAAVAFADDTVGAFLADLKTRGIYDRAIIVLLSDHGEGLGDHGELDHGIFVYSEAIHVPLIVKLPNQHAGRHAGSLAALSDVFPTILGAAGVANAARVDGIDLLRAKENRNREVDAESYYARLHLHWHELTSVVTATHQFIEAPTRELYDLRSDPAEKTNVIDQNRRLAAGLAAGLASRAKPFAGPGAIDAEDQRKLASLGYMSGSNASDGNPYPDPKDRIAFVTRYREAERLARAGETVRAIPMLESVTREAPEILDAWVLLARAKETTGHPDDAIAVLRDAQKHYGDASSVSLALADVLLGRKRYDEARKAAEAATAAEPLRARELLAHIAMQQGNWPEALSTLDLIAGEKSNPIRGLQADRGEALLHLQRGPEAEQAYRQEVAQFPDNVEAWGNLAVILAAQGRNDEARATVAKALQINPGPAAQRMAAEVRSVLR